MDNRDDLDSKRVGAIDVLAGWSLAGGLFAALIVSSAIVQERSKDAYFAAELEQQASAGEPKQAVPVSPDTNALQSRNDTARELVR